jgi:hypothetical protein
MIPGSAAVHREPQSLGAGVNLLFGNGLYLPARKLHIQQRSDSG